ncbi:MAG TPA: SpoIIE family protein phosphatase [Solirubrobacteraceae bacterium]
MLETGETLLLYTDGVTDAQAPDRERFGIARLTAALGSFGETSAHGLLDGLTGKLSDFQRGASADDIAAVAVRRREDTGRRQEKTRHGRTRTSKPRQREGDGHAGRT